MTPHDTPGTLVFWCQRSPRNSTGVTPYEGAECRWGGSKSATFDIYPDISRQEAQLSPRDRAMRRVNWNLANCHATVQILLIRQVLTKSMVWSWRFSRRQWVIDEVHSTMTRPSRFHCLRCIINKPTTVSCVYHLYTDDLLWRNFLSPQCRNWSRDPDHAHLGSTHSSQD